MVSHISWSSSGCLLSPTLFNIFLDAIMTHPLDNYNSTISIGGRQITNLSFTDDIDGITGEEDEIITTFVQNLDAGATKFGREIMVKTPKIMTNNDILQR